MEEERNEYRAVIGILVIIVLVALFWYVNILGQIRGDGGGENRHVVEQHTGETGGFGHE